MRPHRPLARPLALGLAGLTICALAVPARAVTHAGNVSGTWTRAESPHVVLADVVVPAGQTLTIESGSSVVFDPGTLMTVDGTLVATGSPANGRVRMLGSSPEPQPGDWWGVRLAGAGPHRLTHVEISSASTGLIVEGTASVALADSRIADSYSNGMEVRAGGVATIARCAFDRNYVTGLRIAQGSAVEASSCAFVGNGRPAWLEAGATPVLRDLSARGSGGPDGVVLDVDAPWNTTGSLGDAGISHVVESGEWLIGAGAMLSLESGAVVKFGSGATLAVEGVLVTNGRPAGPVTLTSLADDTAGGDTNGDRSFTTPAKADWNCLEVRPGGRAALTGADIRHGDEGVRVLSAGTALLRECHVHDVLARAVAFGPSASGLMQGCNVHDADTGVWVATATLVELAPGGPGGAGQNAFSCMLGVDVENTDITAPLDATGNFWGTEGMAPDASRVAGGVIVDPAWLSEPGAVSAARTIRLARDGAADLRFGWTGVASCASYLLRSADKPEGPFATVVAGLPGPSHVETLAAADGVSLVYFEIALD